MKPIPFEELKKLFKDIRIAVEIAKNEQGHVLVSFPLKDITEDSLYLYTDDNTPLKTIRLILYYLPSNLSYKIMDYNKGFFYAWFDTITLKTEYFCSDNYNLYKIKTQIETLCKVLKKFHTPNSIKFIKDM